jgi:hypothetical protein
VLEDEERRGELDALIVLKNATSAATQALERLSERLTGRELDRLHWETGGRDAALESFKGSDALAEILGPESFTRAERRRRGFIVVPSAPFLVHPARERWRVNFVQATLRAQPWWQAHYGLGVPLAA